MINELETTLLTIYRKKLIHHTITYNEMMWQNNCCHSFLTMNVFTRR